MNSTFWFWITIPIALVVLAWMMWYLLTPVDIHNDEGIHPRKTIK